MRKIRILILMLLLGITLNVYAGTPPYWWTVDLGDGNPREDVTKTTSAAILEKNLEDGKQEYVLKLNNYNGSGIELECHGSAVEGMHFVIELSGTNVINDKNYGIYYNYASELEFRGDGTLTINAPTPISNKQYASGYTIDLSNKDEISESTEETATIEENTDTTLTTSTPTLEQNRNINMVIYIILGVVIAALFGIIAILSYKLGQKSSIKNTK